MTRIVTRLAVLLLGGLALLGSRPSAAGPKVYVGLFKDDAVAVLDTERRQVQARVTVPKGPHGLVMTPDGRKVYVSSDGASTVSVIDTTGDRVTASIDVGPNPHGLAMSADGRRVLVSAWGANEALVIDTVTDRVAGRLPVARPHNAAFSPDGRTAYVGSQQQGATALVVLDLARWVEAARVPLDRTPRALDVSPDGKWLHFTVAGDDAVQVLDTTTNQIVGRIAVGASPHHAPFTADGRWSLVPSQGPGELAVVDVTARTVSATVKVGTAPHWVTAGSDGRLAYVTNETSGDVSIVDLGARHIVATIPVGAGPRKIAVQPASSGAGGRLRTVVEVAAEDYAFLPASLAELPGTPLRIRVTSRSSVLHNVTLPEQRIDRDIPPGATVEIDLEVPPVGTLPFWCKFHAALGQRGEVRAGRPAARVP